MSFIIAACPERKTIGCAIIQAAYGGTVPGHKLGLLPWDLDIEGMQRFEITDEQLDELIATHGKEAR